MMRRSVICFGLAVATCLSVAQSQGPDFARDFVLTDKEAVGLLSPRVVCGSQTVQILWSPDGSVLLAQRRDVQPSEEFFLSAVKAPPGDRPAQAPPTPTQELVFYSPRNNKVRAVVPLGDPSNQVFDLNWVPGSQQVLVEYSRMVRTTQDAAPAITVNLALVSYDGRVTPLISDIVNSQNFQTSVSPTRPIVAVLSEDPSAVAPGQDQPESRKRVQKILLYNASGRLIGSSVTETHAFASPMWGKDGGFYLAFRTFEIGKKKASIVYRRVDLSTAKVGEEVAFPGGYEPKTPVLPVGILPKYLSLGKKDIPETVTAMTLVSTTKHEASEFAVITSDSKEAQLSPTGDSVAYISRGVTMVRPIAHVPKELYMQARAAALRTAILSQSKQIGLAMLMWAGDNDENLPANGADLQNLLGPYLKDNNLLTGFVYSFSGGNMSQIEAPATTELGYVPGSGGRAVIYTDGHVKWKSDKP